jgi:subtilase family serine protease
MPSSSRRIPIPIAHNIRRKFMRLQSSLRNGAVIALVALFAAAGSAHAQQAETNVPAGIQLSRDLGFADSAAEINITVHLKLPDKTAFDKAVDALYDPASPTFHKWMTNADLRKYAPAEGQRQMVLQELQKHGLTILSTDSLGFTIRARGSIASVESAFDTEIHQFEYKGRVFRANVRNARLAGAAGDYVSTVAGLESHQVRPLYTRALDPRTQKPFPPVALGKQATPGFPPGSTTNCLSSPASLTLQGATPLPVATYSGTVYSLDPTLICDYLPEQLWTALGLDQVYASGYNGAGQTIVLVEGFGYPTLKKDANTFFKLASLPLLDSSNFSIVYPEGRPVPDAGILTGWNVEMALDLDWSHSVAPGAKIVVVATNGQDNEDFQHSIMYVAEHSLGNSVSNSYEEDLDLIAGPLEQTSWEDTLEVASAKGISVNFSSGDSGDNGVGSPVGAPGVPAVAPHATSVGGTSILNDVSNPGSTITTAWGDTINYLEFFGEVADPPEGAGLFGGSGGGQSVFWAKPSWQKALPGKGRETPDVSALADPYTGVPIVLTNGSTQFLEFGWGGTSLACPIFSAFWAIANEKAGHALGQAAPAIAALHGGIQDVLPTSDSSRNNVTGTITDESGTTTVSATDLFSGALFGNTGFTSALWLLDDEDVLVFGFGLDSSLTVRRGWDNATGFGTPYGLAFINAVTAKK